MIGIVHHYDPLRRYGKISGEDRREYFVNQHQLVEVAELRTGQLVTFTPTEFPRGPRAMGVHVLELAPLPATASEAR